MKPGPYTPPQLTTTNDQQTPGAPRCRPCSLAGLFLLSSAAVLAAAGAGLMTRWSGAFAAEPIVGKSGEATIKRFDGAGNNLGKATVAKVVKGEEEWWKQLSDIA